MVMGSHARGDCPEGCGCETAQEARMVHAVVKDTTGSGLPRLTCRCGATIVCQPYMTVLEWVQKSTEFNETHEYVTPEA